MDAAHPAAPPPPTAGPPCARPRTPSRRTPLRPGCARHRRGDVRPEDHARPRGRSSRVLRGSVATGVAQPWRSSAEGVSPQRSIPRRTMLIAYDVALDLVRALRPVVAQLRKYSSDAADQVERAAS